MGRELSINGLIKAIEHNIKLLKVSKEDESLRIALRLEVLQSWLSFRNAEAERKELTRMAWRDRRTVGMLRHMALDMKLEMNLRWMQVQAMEEAERNGTQVHWVQGGGEA